MSVPTDWVPEIRALLISKQTARPRKGVFFLLMDINDNKVPSFNPSFLIFSSCRV
jgi:hypothetical protein